MILLSKNVTCISELKKNPSAIKDNLDTCVLSHNKPVYYTVNPSRYAELLESEAKNKELRNCLLTSIDCALSALPVVPKGSDIEMYLKEIVHCKELL